MPFTTWVAHFGVPAHLTLYQGPQFTSAIWGRVCQQLGVEHHLTTAYHPQANGIVERCHRQLKDALRARLADPRWPVHLPWVQLGLPVAPKEDSGISSAKVLYGVPLSLPGQIVAAEEPHLQQLVDQLWNMPSLPTQPVAILLPVVLPTALNEAEMVYVCRGVTLLPLLPKYHEPYHILANGPKLSSCRSTSTIYEENIA